MSVRLTLDLEGKMSRYCVPGVGIAVFRDGLMEWCESYGVLEAGTQHNVTENSLFHACSISKMVTAIGVLRLVQDGVLNLDEAVNSYLLSWKVPDNQYTADKKVTLRSLLAHQAGLLDPEGSFDVYQQQDRFPTPKDLLMGSTHYYPEQLQIKYIPESRFAYSDAGYSLIEQIIEDVTGESFITVMERLVIVPLGLSRTLFWESRTNIEARKDVAVGHDKFGHIVDGKRAQYPNPSGAGLWTTPTELAVITLALIKAWNGDKQSILQPDMVKLMLTGIGCAKGVGLGIFLQTIKEEAYIFSQGWGVGAQCKLVAYPHLNSGIVIMTNSEPGKPQNEALIGEVLREICKAYEWPLE